MLRYDSHHLQAQTRACNFPSPQNWRKEPLVVSRLYFHPLPPLLTRTTKISFTTLRAGSLRTTRIASSSLPSTVLASLRQQWRRAASTTTSSSTRPCTSTARATAWHRILSHLHWTASTPSHISRPHLLLWSRPLH